MILKHHFAIEKKVWQQNLNSDFSHTAWNRDLALQEIKPTYESFRPLLSAVSQKWLWELQDRYQETTLRTRLADKETRLFNFLDGKERVGYSLVVGTPPSLKERFWNAANDKKIVEIENIAIFPGQEGRGRGGQYLAMLFNTLFQEYDTVYLSSSGTNYPTIPNFYKRMGMMLLATDMVEDFRLPERQLA